MRPLLVNTRDGCYLWPEKYERYLTGVFQLQEEIARAIVAALKMKLPGQRSASPLNLCRTYSTLLSAGCGAGRPVES